MLCRPITQGSHPVDLKRARSLVAAIAGEPPPKLPLNGARQVGMVPSAVLERIRKLEKQGIITGYEVRLDPNRFARNLVAFITLTLHTRQDEARCGAVLAALLEVQEVHCVAGDDGILVKVRVSGPEELGRLIRDKISVVEGIRPARTVIVLDTYKETARISIDKQGH